MFAALAQAKVLMVAATATAGLALAAHPAQAEHFHPRFGVNIVLAQPVCPAPVVVATPVVAAPACAPAVVATPAPVYVPAPAVVYAEPVYAPYVVVNRYPHYRFAPVFSFHGGWHR